MSHAHWMQRAICVAENARLLSPPNPWVGCVLVKDGVVVGEGWTQQPGQEHAEVHALTKAGEKAHNATAYVTLEPCCHHGRTGPCTTALAKAGIKEVFFACVDPDERVAGKGALALRQLGIVCHTGLLEEEAALQLRPYLISKRKKSVFCRLKLGLSLDACIAAENGSSQWLSDEKALDDVQILRRHCQAIMVGSETFLKDNPKLNCRGSWPLPLKAPLRVLLDRRGRCEPRGHLADISLAPTIYVSEKKSPSWEACGAHTLLWNGFDALFAELYAKGVMELLCEGGAALARALLDEKRVDELTIYYGPRLLGCRGKRAFLSDAGQDITQALTFELLFSKVLGNTVRCDYTLGDV